MQGNVTSDINGVPYLNANTSSEQSEVQMTAYNSTYLPPTKELKLSGVYVVGDMLLVHPSKLAECQGGVSGPLMAQETVETAVRGES